MMAFKIPVNNTPDRQLDIVLGDNLLTLRTYFNQTLAQWFMDVSDGAGVMYARGLALVPWINLFEANPTLTRTLGQFRVASLDGGENDTSDSLGQTAALYWFAPGEFEALETPEAAGLTPLPFNVADMYHA